MVREANVKQAAAEKRLKEAQGKVGRAAFHLKHDASTHRHLVYSFLFNVLIDTFVPNSPLFFLPDRCSASRGDCAQNPGADVHALLPQPPAAPSAAVCRDPGVVQTRRGPCPQQEHQRSLSNVVD